MGGEGPPNVNACQQGGRGGRKSRKSCQRSLRMPPKAKGESKQIRITYNSIVLNPQTIKMVVISPKIVQTK